MANTNIGISNFVYTQSPFFARNDHPNFIRFVEAYYEYMEQEGKTIERAKGFREALDVDKSIDIYTDQLYSQFLHSIPKEAIADKNLILKHIKDFYRARGTEKSVQFLMSILYDEDVNFYYPKKDILRASDGKWYLEKSLKVFDVQVNNVSDSGIFTVKNFAGRQIRGATSNATATVESVDVYYESGVAVKELKISNQVRDFRAGEIVRAKFEEEGLTKDISANVFSGIIVRVDIQERGNNYLVGTIIDKANVESNTGAGAVIVISDVSRAAIKSISAEDGGAGFQNSNVILISGLQGFGANANVSLVSADGAVHPNTYNIAITLIGAEANSLIGNTLIGNTSSNPYESFAYPNMSFVLVTLPGNTSNLTANTDSGVQVGTLKFTQLIANSNVFMKTGDSINAYNTQTATSYVLKITSSSTTSNQISFTPLIPGSIGLNRVVVIPDPFNAYSNLTISCGSGTPTLINLSAWKANSNVFFETFDNLYCFGTNVTIIQSNTKTSQLVVSPGLPGPLTNQPFQILKKPNKSTTLANSLGFFTYANTGPIQRVLVLLGGNNYTGNISLTAQANTRVRNLGILGKMVITNPGSGYVAGEEIEFINRPYATYDAGSGARGYVASVNGTGAITSVKFKQVPGYYIGGSGYSMDYLPRANIITSAGIGGNVVATAVLGGGEKLISTSDDIGAILSLTIISGGSGYMTPPVINLQSFGSGTAQAKATIIQGVYSYPGRYLNDDGMPSSFNFLQDGRYYHNYSYVLRIKKSIESYRKALKDLVHPAGLSVFGEYITVDEGDTMNIQLSTANTTTKMKYQYATYTANVVNVTANLSNVKISRTNHGVSNGTMVYLEYQSGDTINIGNGIFKASIVNANTFIVTQANAVNVSGNVYYGIVI